MRRYQLNGYRLTRNAEVGMSNDGIFLIREGQLMVLSQRPYESEALLQQALASFPAVLAGSTTGEGDASSLLLVKREMGVPSSDGGSPQWSLDHLFVDTEGVPVVVEVKRSSDTRIRREVVGQMLDYAANAVRYWPVDDLRAAFETTAEAEGTSGEERLQAAIPGADADDFWSRVEGNLAAGRIRMVFVADAIPAELVRVIEFLNEQMSPAEVLGVEVPQFVGGDHQVLVPRVVGRTSAAVATKQRSGTSWDEESFLASADRNSSPEVASFLRRLLDHAKKRGIRLNWGKAASPGVAGWYLLGDTQAPVWTANTGGERGNPHMSLWLPHIAQHTPREQFRAFAETLEAVPPFAQKVAEARKVEFEGKYPQWRLVDVVASPAYVDGLFAALDLLGTQGEGSTVSAPSVSARVEAP
jgi:hypothetical protein